MLADKYRRPQPIQVKHTQKFMLSSSTTGVGVPGVEQMRPSAVNESMYTGSAMCDGEITTLWWLDVPPSMCEAVTAMQSPSRWSHRVRQDWLSRCMLASA
jgi:hypothetical protein